MNVKDIKNVMSLFDGMSCGQIALGKVGAKLDNYYASEIDQNAINVTRHNYPNTKHIGSVVDVDVSKFEHIDMLIGGSSCQDFSFAGAMNGMVAKGKIEITTLEHYLQLKEDGFEFEGQSYLFWEYIRVLKDIQRYNPSVIFLLENVKMTKKWERIISTAIGVRPVKINSNRLTAQSRPRLYWTNIPNIEQPEDRGILLNDILVDGWSDRIKATCLLESDSRPLRTPVKMFHRRYGVGFTNIVMKSKDHWDKCVKHYNENFKGLLGGDIECDSDVYDGVRYLYQEELEELQTVPKGYTSCVTRDVAAGLLGNGWSVDVIVHMFKNIGQEHIPNPIDEFFL